MIPAAACIWAYAGCSILHAGCRNLHTSVMQHVAACCILHTGVMQDALRRYAAFIRSYAGCIRAYEAAYRRNASCITPVCRMQHAARRSYAGFCSLHAGCCNLHTPVCRLQPESLGCIRSHFEKCTWLVDCCRFKATRPPRCTSWARLTATCSSNFRLKPHADFLWSSVAAN